MENKFSKEVIEQYEKVRESGICNMFDRGCVIRVSGKLGFVDLKDVGNNQKEYGELLQNYSKLMKKYNISQK